MAKKLTKAHFKASWSRCMDALHRAEAALAEEKTRRREIEGELHELEDTLDDAPVAEFELVRDIHLTGIGWAAKAVVGDSVVVVRSFGSHAYTADQAMDAVARLDRMNATLTEGDT